MWRGQYNLKLPRRKYIEQKMIWAKIILGYVSQYDYFNTIIQASFEISTLARVSIFY